MSESQGMRGLTVASVVVVAGVAAVVSYGHMRDLALEAGEDDVAASLLPVSVDGMLLAATLTALVRKRAAQPVGVAAWAGIVLGVAASIAANVAAADPTWTGRLVAAWPPVALFVSLKMLLVRAPDITVARTPTPPRPATPAPPQTSSNGSAPKVNGKPSDRVEELLPRARRIRDGHSGKLSRRVLKEGLEADGEPAGTATLVALLERLEAEAN